MELTGNLRGERFVGLDAGGNDLEVLIGDEGLGGGVGGGVVLGPEDFEGGGEALLTGFVETAEGYLGGAEVLAEEVDGTGGVEGEVEGEGDEGGLDVGEEG